MSKTPPNRRVRRTYRHGLWWIVLCFAACLPASPPPRVEVTTAPGAVITRDTYRNDLFSVTYPEGWRVITSPTGAPPSVTFVAPGDCSLIVVSSAPVDQPPASSSCSDVDNFLTDQREVTLSSAVVTVALLTPTVGSDSIFQELDRVIASLRSTP